MVDLAGETWPAPGLLNAGATPYFSTTYFTVSDRSLDDPVGDVSAGMLEHRVEGLFPKRPTALGGPVLLP